MEEIKKNRIGAEYLGQGVQCTRSLALVKLLVSITGEKFFCEVLWNDNFYSIVDVYGNIPLNM